MKNLFKIVLMTGALFTGAFVFYKISSIMLNIIVVMLKIIVSMITGIPIESL
jgi:hypothetical protein